MRGLIPAAMTQGALRPLTVTAHVPTGFAAADPCSPSLDGILAWAFMRDQPK